MNAQSLFQWSRPDTQQNRESYEETRVWRATHGRWEGAMEPADCYIQLAADGRLYGKCIPMELAG